ncbi:thiamine-phosphate kinase [Sulfurimonas sp. ST-25]|uniref:thiamine-phosphate kinase n=1 Tax=Sulfurimonas sp. ST-25 TaxID=3400151 RepID=UPI003A8BB6C8
MDLEKRFIASVAAASKQIGDDGAVIGSTVYSNDAFIEGTHFKRAWMTPRQIAYKAFAVNISDAVAMNAVPRYALLAIGIPSSFTAGEVDALAAGFVEASAAFGCELVGGDTVKSDRLIISLTIVSETRRPLRRSGIKRGDLLAFTGSVGKAKRELQYLLAGRRAHAQSHYVRPPLRREFIAAAAPYLRAGMDISDGIYTDLQRLADLNRTGFSFFRPLGKSAGCSGEEYEMLVAFPPRMRKRVEYLARKHRTPLTVFARAARTRYKNPCKSHHF